MKCIVCDTHCPYSTIGVDTLYPPIHGTMFEATGNYGSTVWDLEGRKFLQVVICDACVKLKADQINVVVWDAPPQPSKQLVRRVDFSTYRAEQGL